MANVLIFTDYADFIYGKSAGPYRVATELRNHGYTVQVIEYLSKWPPEFLQKAVDKFVDSETLFVGFCTTFFQGTGGTIQTFQGRSAWKLGDFTITDEDASHLLGWIREKNPNVKLVMGGANAIRCSNPIIDYYVGGYADTAIVALANHLKHGSKLEGMRLLNGSIYIDAQKHYPVEIFNHGIEFEPQDIMDAHTPLPAEIARGCIFKCSFCAFPLNGKGRNDYMRDFGKIREELIRNYELFGAKSYLFVDDTYNDAIDKVEGMANMVATLPFKPEWAVFARLDIMCTDRNREMPMLMKESGVKSVAFGIETMYHEAGKKIGKGMHPDKTIEALHWIREQWGDDVLTQSNMIIGLPGEPVDSIYRTHELFMQPNFPLHSFHWGAYTMYPKVLFPTQVFTSQIEAKPDHFGYIQATDGNWKNEHMDRTMAQNIEVELNDSEEARKRNMIAGIRYMHYKMIMDPEADYWKSSWYDLTKSDYFMRTAMRIREYIDAVLAY